MKRLVCLMCALLLLVGCTPSGQNASHLNIVTTTYPTYLAALAVTEGVMGISVSRLDTGSVSCLHDYTLTVSDMKKLSRADVIVMNGAGLEDFLSDALSASSATVIDCSEGIELLPASGHHDHEHEHEHDGHYDPHYWMDPLRAQIMTDNLYRGLVPLLPQQADRLRTNADLTHAQLQIPCDMGRDYLHLLEENNVSVPGLITFHDGFQYFAHAFDLPLLRAIEEEAGSEASAKEILNITQLVKEFGIPVIFTETNGSDATAKAIARETGCNLAQLSMIMDGREPSPEDPSPIAPYTELFLNNVYTLINGFAEREVVHLP